MEAMSSEPPAGIPPRTSSTGMGNSSIPSERRASVLGSLSEGEWMGSSKRSGAGVGKHNRNSSSTDWTKHKDGFWTTDKEKILLGPYDYMQQNPGKDIRSRMIAAFNAWLDVPSESLAVISKVITMLHTASLLVDDVEDSSTLRRGVPVAHNIFGTAQTINSANYVYFLALQEIQKLNNPTAIDIYVQELLSLHRGQGLDLFWRDSLTCPTEEEYLDMVGNKTGGLFRLAVKLMQAESKTQRECVPLVNLMGLIFQICDDYLNLCDTGYSKNKGLCEDLTEGKFSFPIIHSIRADPNNIQLINILKLKTDKEEVKLYAVRYMESTGSFAYTRNFVARLHEQALQMIDEIDGIVGGKSKEGESTSQGVREILQKIVDSTMGKYNQVR